MRLDRLAGRKKNTADLEGIRLRNLESAIEIYEKVHSELKEQLETSILNFKNDQPRNFSKPDSFGNYNEINKRVIKIEQHLKNKIMKQLFIDIVAGLIIAGSIAAIVYAISISIL